MKTFTFYFFLLLLVIKSALASETEATTRVLMLISGYGSEEQPALSYDLEELAQAYLVLHDNGVKVDLVTPKGGPVLVKTNKDALAYIQRFKSVALTQLQNTLPAHAIDTRRYQGVFIVGGAGAMFDLPADTATQHMLTEFVADNVTIAAVCHGPAAIADITLPDGQFFVAGKQVNGFTNKEENAFSGEHIASFPFLVQDRLTQNGGRFVYNHPMLPFVAVDGNLITAQNPPSVPRAAEMLLLKLGITPQKRAIFNDEATMQLLADAHHSGASVIDIAMAKKPDAYDLNYLALYGFYAYPLAADEDKARALDLMQTIAAYFQHPAYEAAMIKALCEQGRLRQARVALNTFLQRYPGHDDAPALSALVNSHTPHSDQTTP
ncbi:type 1 glutamine amidotransferase domain-containing protein [Alteromonas sp. CYL-A6]|uniref:type 1 glutamine amidotransferase domain-containing protein n=1 Tax=Alteromonas nitratireducens TaxID=3390813 RepID=UPI0034C48094